MEGNGAMKEYQVTSLEGEVWAVFEDNLEIEELGLFSDAALAAQALADWLGKDELEREGWKKTGDGDGLNKGYLKGVLRIYELDGNWYLRREPDLTFSSSQDALAAIKEAAKC